MGKTGTLICMYLLALFTASCNYSNNNSDKNHINKEKPQTKEQITKELETITLFYDGSGDISLVALMSDGLISFVEEGYDDIDTLELKDKNDKLFIDLQRLLKTAIIDSTMYIGRTDTILRYEKVKNIIGVGFVIKRTNTTTIDTIIYGSSEYQRLKNGKYECVKPGMTVVCTYSPDWYDIPADHMLLYRYKNHCIANDTLCYNRSSNIVRINSYVAEVDSALFEDVTERIREFTFE